MNFQSVKTIAKWAWTAAILALVVWYCVTRADLIAKTLSLLSVEFILLATLAIILAKIGLAITMRAAAAGAGLALSMKDSYWIYNMTQLGKYVPGSIWQLVGRVVILKRRGVPTAQIRDAILAEHAWVVATASFMAAALILLAKPHFFLDWADNVGISPKLVAGVVAAVAAVALVTLFAVFKARFFLWLWRLRPTVPAVLVLFGTWILLGLSLWITLGPFATAQVPWYYVVGIYCFAYVAGFLVPFAPAGLGIRESILTFGLLPYMPVETGLLLASINRVLYFAAEMIVVIPCLFWERDRVRAVES